MPKEEWLRVTLLPGFVRAGVGAYYQDRYVQDERYFANEHMDVRREASRRPHMCLVQS